MEGSETTARMTAHAAAQAAGVEVRLRLLDPPAEWEPSTGVAIARFHARVDAAVAAKAQASGWTGWRASAASAGFASAGFASTRTASVRVALASVARARAAFSRAGAVRAARAAWPAWRPALAAAALVVLVVFTFPAARAAAQQMWRLLWVGRLEVLRLDLANVPSSLEAKLRATPELHRDLGDVTRAAELAGFVPRLPDARIGLPAPTLGMMGPMSFDVIVRRADLVRALEKASLASESIPSTWEGAQLSAHLSAIVEARYPGMELLQARPIAIAAPEDFDFPRFSELLLRIGGLDAAAARALAKQAAPIGFLPVRPDESVTIRPVALAAGPGTLVHDLDGEGRPERATLIWSTSDRLFIITADEPDDARVIAVANAIPIHD